MLICTRSERQRVASACPRIYLTPLQLQGDSLLWDALPRAKTPRLRPLALRGAKHKQSQATPLQLIAESQQIPAEKGIFQRDKAQSGCNGCEGPQPSRSVAPMRALLP